MRLPPLEASKFDAEARLLKEVDDTRSNRWRKANRALAGSNNVSQV
jgi:hypothetical protein